MAQYSMLDEESGLDLVWIVWLHDDLQADNHRAIEAILIAPALLWLYWTVSCKLVSFPSTKTIVLEQEKNQR